MTKHKYLTHIKPDFSVTNHTEEAKNHNLRSRYRFYLAEMREYGFVPMDFRTWYKWYIYHKGKSPVSTLDKK